MIGRETLIKRSSKSWVSEKMIQLFNEAGFDDLLEDGIALIKKRRVLDFVVSNGCFSARVYGDVGAPKVVSFTLSVLSDEEWNRIFSSMAKKSLFSASILADRLPKETNEAFITANAELFPESPAKFTITIDNETQDKLDDRAAAVIYRFCDRLVDDPFLLFVLRGRGKEETIVELRRHRLKIAELEQDNTSQHLPEEGERLSIPAGAEFWQTANRRAFEELSYNIKADELPAAILKWLDPLPLAGIEDDVEPLLEESYEHITNRAQAYGLGLS